MGKKELFMHDMKPITPPKKRTDKAKQRSNEGTVNANPLSERLSSKSVLDEVKSGVREKRINTIRDSFETTQPLLDRIAKVQLSYRLRFGKRLPKSRIIRDGVEAYLDKLEREL